MAKQTFAIRKSVAKGLSAGSDDSQSEVLGCPSGQDGDQPDKGQERVSGQKVTPKKHWLKVLPAIEEFNNRVDFRLSGQKQSTQSPVATSSGKPQLKSARETTSKKPNKSTASVPSTMKSPQLQSSPQGGTSQKQPKLATMTPNKSGKSHPSQEPATQKQYMSTVMPASKPGQIQPLQGTPDQVASKKNGVVLSSMEDYSKQLAASGPGQSQPDGTGDGGSQEPVQVGIDSFIGSDRVVTLEDKTFNQFVASKDITLVMFYDKNCPLSSWSKSHFKQAAEMTNRPNHQYAAVDCTKGSENEICNTEGIFSVPFFKVYSRGTTVARIKEPRTFQADIMKKVVERTPVKKIVSIQSSPVD